MINILKKDDEIFLNALKKISIDNTSENLATLLFGLSDFGLDNYFCEKGDIKLKVLEIADDSNVVLFLKESVILLEIIDGYYLGKNNEDYFIFTDYAELWGAGKEIQNTCNILRGLLYAPLDMKEDLLDQFQYHTGKDYEQTIKDYKIFCEELGLTYIEEDSYWEEQAKEFDKFVLENGLSADN